MKTGDKFHVEKENYDRLRQSFTERLEKGKTVTGAYPVSTEDRSRATRSLLQKEHLEHLTSGHSSHPHRKTKTKAPNHFLESELPQIFSLNLMMESQHCMCMCWGGVLI